MDSSSPQAVFGPTNPSPTEREKPKVKRFASVIGLCPEKEAYYRELHANVWPSILELIKLVNLQNFSIHISEIEEKKYLFSYYEYTGFDYEEDMKTLAKNPEMQKWWKETSACQIRMPGTNPNEQWKEMEMLFQLR